MAVNSDLKKYAVFINSKNDVNPSTSKSDVTIPFTGNLANHDPLRTVKISIVDVLFSNIFYNVREGVNTFRFVNLFKAGRNKPASYKVTEVVIPDGFYNYDTFSAWANENLTGINSSVTYSGTGAPVGAQNVYYGFGSSHAGVVNNAVDACEFSLALAKVWMVSASLGDLYQPYVSDNTITPSTPESNIYAGTYLIDDSVTYGMLHQLGYSFNGIYTPPNIPGTPFKGWGIPIYSRQTGGATEYSFDNIVWGTSSASTVTATSVPFEVSDFTGLDDLYIHCPQLRTQYQSAIGKAPNAPNDVVAVIPINVAFGEKMSYIPNFPLECFLMNTNITQLQFRMTNSNNIPLDFKGIDWGLTMYCEEMVDESRAQLEDNPDGVRPDVTQLGRYLNTTGYMEGRLKRQKQQISDLSRR